MSMNIPNNQPSIDNTAAVTPDVTQAAPEVDNTQAAQPDTTPVQQDVAQVEQAAPETTQEQVVQEEQAVEAIGQAIADEQISARDILTAIISDTIGLSPAGANSLIDILMTDLIDDQVAADTVATQQAADIPTDVPPQV